MSVPGKPKVVVLSGSGLSAESGLPTFRDSAGLWNKYSWVELASPEGWARQPEVVLAFYNERRAKAWTAEPNAAHRAIASLEQKFDVTVVTQNVDALHERAGSTRVLHVHGELAWARGTGRSRQRYRIDDAPIELGQTCDEGTQLRPDIVWFGEETQHMDEAREHVTAADKVLVVGTSLTVYPAAGLVDAARNDSECVLVSLEMDEVPSGFRYLQGKATEEIPKLIADWLGGNLKSRTGTSIPRPEELPAKVRHSRCGSSAAPPGQSQADALRPPFSMVACVDKWCPTRQLDISIARPTSSRAPCRSDSLVSTKFTLRSISSASQPSECAMNGNCGSR